MPGTVLTAGDTKTEDRAPTPRERRPFLGRSLEYSVGYLGTKTYHPRGGRRSMEASWEQEQVVTVVIANAN